MSVSDLCSSVCVRVCVSKCGGGKGVPFECHMKEKRFKIPYDLKNFENWRG